MLAKIVISPNLNDLKPIFEDILKLHHLTQSHPDVLYIDSSEKMGVEQARKIKQHFSYKPNQAQGKAVVIEHADNISLEAQNILLKTIEELPELACFIMGASSESVFIPTVLSRCELIELNFKEPTLEQAVIDDIEQLIASNVEARFEYVEKAKDKNELLLQLVKVFEKKLHSSTERDLKLFRPFIAELLEAEKWADQNVNIRGILEYLMLIMPTKE